jgi:peptidoglycan/xylan/chitin deacetylase (PgdA/CDA1 family)
MYHRVGEVEGDPWGMAVSPAHFAEQLAVLQEYRCLAVGKMAQEIGQGNVPRGCIAVTFDDGYADNLHQAKPLLQNYAIPATIFVTSGHIGVMREFWWDELAQMILQPAVLPSRLVLDLETGPDKLSDKQPFVWALGSASTEPFQATSERPWEARPGSRLEFYYRLWFFLRSLSYPQREAALNLVAEWSGVQVVCRPSHRTLTPAEAHDLGRDDLVEIGAHTRTHPSLITLDKSTQRYEIEQSKTDLETLFQREIGGFSYPHGEYTSETAQLVHNAGFAYGCTVHGAVVGSSPDLLQLPRYEVQDWGGDEFKARLQQWLLR